MKKAELQNIFYWKGEAVEVIAINDGHRSIMFRPVNAKPCPCCGETKQYDVIESSPLFQENAEPVKTIA